MLACKHIIQLFTDWQNMRTNADLEQVLLSFVNNWGTTGGVDQFVAWSPTASTHQHFFTDAGCRAMYRASVAAVINRINSINGRRCLRKEAPSACMRALRSLKNMLDTCTARGISG